MPPIETTPFERAICALILEVPETWSTPQLDELPEVVGKAIHRLVIGGFIQAKISASIAPKGEFPESNLHFRVCGNYPDVVRDHISRTLQILGFADETGRMKNAVEIRLGHYEQIRLTSEGALARQVLKNDKIDCYEFELISGGHDGSGGVKPKGVVEFDRRSESETRSNPQSKTQPSDKPVTPNSHVDERENVPPLDAKQQVVSRKKLRQPSSRAIAAYRVWFATQRPQSEIAELLTQQTGFPTKQNQVSRMLKQVNRWLSQGNVLPDLPKTPPKAKAIDPSIIDLGNRTDHRTLRQRERGFRHE